MNDELIRVTEYGAEFERTWMETDLHEPWGILMSTMDCRCPCTTTCPKANNPVGIAFPGY